ncbi:hypothetical protein BGX26_004838, partial [Mortierella sp. AD094]
KFATIEALTIIGMILQSFDLEMVEPSKIAAYTPALILQIAGGLNVRVSRRSGAKAI